MTDHQAFIDAISAHVLVGEIPKAQAELLIACVRRFETEQYDASILHDIRKHYRLSARTSKPTLEEVHAYYIEAFR